jgi:hypothetical protein
VNVEYLVIDVQVFKEAFFFGRGYFYEVRRNEVKEEEKGGKTEQEASH